MQFFHLATLTAFTDDGWWLPPPPVATGTPCPGGAEFRYVQKWPSGFKAVVQFKGEVASAVRTGGKAERSAAASTRWTIAKPRCASASPIRSTGVRESSCVIFAHKASTAGINFDDARV